jgi:hypothetical protein
MSGQNLDENRSNRLEFRFVHGKQNKNIEGDTLYFSIGYRHIYGNRSELGAQAQPEQAVAFARRSW